MTDYQEGVPVRGDYMFYPYTWHSIELNATLQSAGMGRPGRSASRSKKTPPSCPTAKWDWVDGRQTEFYLIK